MHAYLYLVQILIQLVREKLQFLKQNLLIHALLETLWFKYFTEIQYSHAKKYFH